MSGRPPLRSCSGPCGFLRRPGLCVPGEEPARVELEGQAAFSGLNWFETTVPAAAWVWLWVREAAEVMCSQTLGCSPPGPAPWKRRRAWCAGPRAGGVLKGGAGRLLARCPLLHWATTLCMGHPGHGHRPSSIQLCQPAPHICSGAQPPRAETPSTLSAGRALQWHTATPCPGSSEPLDPSERRAFPRTQSG